MSSEMPETRTEPENPAQGRNPALERIGLTLVFLIFVFLVLVISLQVFALFAWSPTLLVVGFFFQIGIGVLAGLVALVIKKLGNTAERWDTAVTSGRETYSRVKEEVEARYKSARSEKKSQSGRDLYWRIREEAEGRYGRPRMIERVVKQDNNEE